MEREALKSGAPPANAQPSLGKPPVVVVAAVCRQDKRTMAISRDFADHFERRLTNWTDTLVFLGVGQAEALGAFVNLISLEPRDFAPAATRQRNEADRSNSLAVLVVSLRFFERQAESPVLVGSENYLSLAVCIALDFANRI